MDDFAHQSDRLRGLLGRAALRLTPVNYAVGEVLQFGGERISVRQRAAFDGRIDLKDVREGTYGKADVFTFDASSPDVRPLPPVDVKGNRIAYHLPPLSATLFVCH